MERYNLFNLVHKGLRASLYQTALHLQRTDFTREKEKTAAIERVNEIIMLFEGHANKEDHFVLPAIATYEPSVVAAFEAEHEEDERLAHQLKECLKQIESAETYLELLIAGKNLNESFVAFVAFNLVHMSKEESCINPILWRYYSDEELQAISGRIVESIPPWMMDFYANWMVRGVNDHEAFAWFQAVELTMPEVVHQTLLQKAKQEWTEERFLQFQETSNQKALVA